MWLMLTNCFLFFPFFSYFHFSFCFSFSFKITIDINANNSYFYFNNNHFSLLPIFLVYSSLFPFVFFIHFWFSLIVYRFLSVVFLHKNFHILVHHFINPLYSFTSFFYFLSIYFLLTISCFYFSFHISSFFTAFYFFLFILPFLSRQVLYKHLYLFSSFLSFLDIFLFIYAILDSYFPELFISCNPFLRFSLSLFLLLLINLFFLCLLQFISGPIFISRLQRFKLLINFFSQILLFIYFSFSINKIILSFPPLLFPIVNSHFSVFLLFYKLHSRSPSPSKPLHNHSSIAIAKAIAMTSWLFSLLSIRLFLALTSPPCLLVCVDCWHLSVFAIIAFVGFFYSIVIDIVTLFVV